MLLQPWLAGVLNRLIGRHSTMSPRRRKSASLYSRERLLSDVQILESRALLSVQTITVNSPYDLPDSLLPAGTITLRDAITKANIDNTGDTINFDASLTSSKPLTITLHGTELDITASMTITGPGAGLLSISGNDATRIFNIDDGSSTFSQNVVISDLTLEHGQAVNATHTNDGGAIYNAETTQLLRCEFLNNNANDSGGAVYNTTSARATLTSTTFSSNKAGSGGAIGNYGAVTSRQNTFSYNVARADAGGGAVLNQQNTQDPSQSFYRSENDTVAFNSATAGSGGAISNLGGDVVLINDTIVGNTSLSGAGGIANDTFFLKSYVVNALHVYHSNGYFGGGYYTTEYVYADIYNSASLSSLNTIIVGNTTNANETNLVNGLFHAGTNNSPIPLSSVVAQNTLVGDNVSAVSMQNGVSGNQLGARVSSLFVTDANGAPLLSNTGGLTQTIDLVANSPAIGNGRALSDLSTSVDDTSTTLVLTTTSNIAVGDLLRLDSEIVRVQSVNNSNTTLTVQRAQGGTKAQSHYGSEILLAYDQRGFIRGTNDIGAVTPIPTSIRLTNVLIKEFSPAGTFVGRPKTFEATPGNSYEYSLVSGEGSADNAEFTFDSIGRLVTTQFITSSGKSQFSIRIRSADNFGNSIDNVFTISIVKSHLAENLTVDSSKEYHIDGLLTLREAIFQANADQPGDTISFTGDATTNPIILDANQGELDIMNSMTIKGNGDVAISGGGKVRIFNIDDDNVDVTDNVLIQRVTLEDGTGQGLSGSAIGGAVLNAEHLDLNEVTIFDSTAAMGAGIANNGYLDSYNSVFKDNSAQDGGGVWNTGTFSSVYDTFTGNSATKEGGGIASDGGLVYLWKDTLLANHSGGVGGGIYNYYYLNIYGSSISGNTASASGGGVYIDVYGYLVSENDSFFGTNSAPYGGGIENVGSLTSTGDTFSGNTALFDGGAIFNKGTAKALSDTISENAAASFGGGIYNDGGVYSSLTTVNSTIAGNTAAMNGGGIYDSGSNIKWNSLNTIVAENKNGTGGSNFVTSGSETIDARHTLLGDVSPPAGIVSNSSTGNIVGTGTSPIFVGDGSGNPLLTDNGGTTQTIALAPKSLAIGAGGFVAKLSVPLSNSAKTMSVSDATFVIVGTMLRIDNEIVFVIGLSDNTVSIARGQGGTVPADHDINATAGFATDQRGIAIISNDIGSFATASPTGISLANSSVLEHSLVGTIVGGLKTVEAGKNDTQTYSLVPGAGSTDNASFAIDSNDNLVTAKILDYATQNSYSIRVQTTDEYGRTFDQVFAISLAHAHAPRPLVVTTLSDTPTPGQLTLRQAIDTANSDAPGDNIGFANTLSGTITLDPNQGEIGITNSMTISTTGSVTVSGGNQVRIFDIDNGNPSITDNVYIAGLTLTLGNAIGINALGASDDYGINAFGGALTNAENLTLVDVNLRNNSARTYGGAIYNTGEIHSSNDTFSQNSVSHSDGGGIYNRGVIHSDGDTFSQNSAFFGGGAIFNTGYGVMYLASDTISGNFLTSSSTTGGGGIWNQGTMDSTFDSFTGNKATEGGGLFNYGTVNSSNDLFIANSALFGGGIENDHLLSLANDVFTGNNATGDPAAFMGYGGAGGAIANSGTLTSSDNSFTGGSASSGGGIDNFASLTSTGDTFSGNSATNVGGGLSNDGGTAILTSDTIANNTAVDGGGIYNAGSLITVNATIAGNNATTSGGGVDFYNNTGLSNVWNSLNTIVAGNKSGTVSSDVAKTGSGGTINATSTLIGDVNSSGGITATTSNGNILNVAAATIFVTDASANPILADNGGPTETVALVANSQAIKASGAIATLATEFTPASSKMTVENSALIIVGDMLRIDAEIVQVVGIQQNTVYVNRGQFGTTAADHVANSPVTLGVDQTGTPISRSVLGARATAHILNVNTTQDEIYPGAVTLRDAVDIANHDISGETITFATSVTGTITLAQGEISILNKMTIAGPGSGVLSISGNDSSRAFYVAAPAAITGLTMTHGNGMGKEFSGKGGLLYNASTLSLTSDNVALGMATTGGGIFTSGSLNSTNDTFDNNSAVTDGGAIAIQSGSLSSSGDLYLSNKAFDGGSVFEASSVSSAVLAGDIFSGNNASGRGGALYVGSTTTSANNTFDHNLATGVDGSRGLGGAIYISTANGTNAKFQSTNDTIADNTSNNSGGGIYNAGTLVTVNDTIAGNVATDNFHLVDSKVYLTSGGGVYDLGPTGLWDSVNTIVAGNTNGVKGSDVQTKGAVVGSNTHNNLIGDSNSAYGFGTRNVISAPTASVFKMDATSNSPALGNNGGPTDTIPLPFGSPAIGASGALATTTGFTDNSTTRLYVEDATFLAVGDILRIDSELVKVTDISSQTSSVAGAGSSVYTVTVQRGTANAQHNPGAPITLAYDQTGFTRFDNTKNQPTKDIGARSSKHGLVGAITTLSDTPVPGLNTARQVVSVANSDDPPVAVAGGKQVIQGGDTISFAPGLTGTLTLTQGPLLITNAMTIQGPGPNDLTISTSDNSPVFAVNSGDPAVFDQVSLQDMGINGTFSNQGNLLLSNVAFTGATSLISYATNPLTSVFAPYNGALATLIDDSNTTGDTTPYSATISWDNGAPSNQVTFTSTGNSGFDVSDPVVFTVAGTHTYHIVITDTNGESTSVDGTLLVASSSHEYFVNAGSTHGEYSTAGGSNKNSGITRDQPMADLSALINAYHPHAGDTIFVDAGTYHLLTNIVLSPQDSGVTIMGPTDPSTGPAILDRGNGSTGSDEFELSGATDVTISGLSLTGGANGVFVDANSGSERLTVKNDAIYGNTGNGIEIDSGNANATVSGNAVHDNGQYGGGVGIIVSDAPNAVIVGNDVYGNVSTGIQAFGGNLSSSQRIQISGNHVHNNGGNGISASFFVLVSGNEIYHAAVGRFGLELRDRAEASENDVFDNVDGVLVGGSSSAGDAPSAHDNRVYDNSDVGITAYSNSVVTANSVYSNGTGIFLQGPVRSYYEVGSNVTLASNLVYSNTSTGISIDNFSGVRILNNTVYQDVGDAIDAYGWNGSSNLQLRNNILWVSAGVDLNIASNSQVGFDSDYNDLYATGTGVVGMWQGESVPNLAAWAYSLMQDRHSLSTDPQFATGGFQLQNTSIAIDAGDPASPYSAEPAPNGGRVNLGYTGNTADANTSPSPLLQVLVPIGLDKFQVGVPTTITWRSDGLTSSATVAVDVSTDGGSTWTTLATGVGLDSSGNGSLSWTPTVENDSTPLPSTLIRVRSDDGQGAVGESAPFLIANGGHNYYVSPGGNDVNSGKSSDQPMADLSALINAYHPHTGDTIHVAAGTYHLLTNIVLGPQDSGVTIMGPTDSSVGPAILDRGNGSTGSDEFELSGATDVTISGLSLTGGANGVFVDAYSGSNRLTVKNNAIYGNTGNGIEIDSGNANATVSGNAVHDNGQYGGGVGIIVSDAPNAVIVGNDVYGNVSTGIQAFGGNLSSSQEIQISGNHVHDNGGNGISASFFVLVSGNEISGTGAPHFGLEIGIGAEASSNDVFNNVDGIRARGASVHNNRVYDNSDVGIECDGTDYIHLSVDSNSIYSNRTGIYLYGPDGSLTTVTNNLVYDNTRAGLSADRASNTQIVNNTIRQPLGDAVDIYDGSSGLRLRNNILWVSVGADLNIASDSQASFDSDNNLFFVSPDPYAHLGVWGNTTVDVTTPALHDWQTISNGDANSVFGDPTFVNLSTADFHLSKGSPAAGAGDPLSAPAVDYDGKPRNNSLGFTEIGAFRGPSVLAAPTVPKTQAAFEGNCVTNVVLGAFIDSYSSTVSADFSLTDVNWGGILAGTPPKLSVISDPSYVGSGSGWKVVADTVTYAEKGTYPVSLNVADVAGGTITLSQTSFNVADAPLSDTTLARTINTIEGQANTNVVLMTFTDANPFAPVGDFSATNFNWVGTLAGTLPTISLVRDTSYVGSGSGWKVVADTVTFGHAGSYSVALTAKDVDGSTISTNKTSFSVASSAILKSLVKGPLVASSSYLISGSVTASESGYNVSGVSAIAVYVAIDNKPFSATPLVTLSPNNLNFTYQGTPGHNYYFRSIAADAVGNVESKTTIDTSIFIAVPPPVTMVASATPNAANATITLNISGTDPYAGGIASFAIYASVNGGVRQLVGNVVAGTPDGSGVYHASVTYQAAADGVSKTYAFYSVGTDVSGRIEATHAAPDVSITQTFASTPLAFTGLTIQHGLAERSFVEFVDLNFNKGGTDLAALYANLVAHPANYLQMLQRAVGSSTNKTISLTGVKFSLIGTSIELDFGANGLGGVARGSLSLANYWSSLITGDGWYKLNLDLTGSANFTGASYGSFERLLGDTNGDGKVDATDVNLVNSLQGTSTNANGDLNGDGTCDSTDKYLVGKSNGRSVGANPF